MRCQKCHNNEATVHIAGTTTSRLREDPESSNEEFKLHFCEPCAAEYQRAKLSKCLFPDLNEAQITEQLRVMSVTLERTVLRLIRTEAEAMPVDWSLLTSRVGEAWPVGAEITMTFTPSELEWLQGRRDLS